MSHKEIIVALSHIKFMWGWILTNFTIGLLGLKVGGDEARGVKVRDVSAILTGVCSWTVIC